MFRAPISGKPPTVFPLVMDLKNRILQAASSFADAMMVWACEEEGGDVCRAKDASNGTTRKEEKG